jgi:hypothetical protein
VFARAPCTHRNTSVHPCPRDRTCMTERHDSQHQTTVGKQLHQIVTPQPFPAPQDTQPPPQIPRAGSSDHCNNKSTCHVTNHAACGTMPCTNHTTQRIGRPLTKKRPPLTFPTMTAVVGAATPLYLMEGDVLQLEACWMPCELCDDWNADAVNKAYNST